MKSHKKYWFIGAILIILHVVGAIGTMFSFIRPWMQALTPLNLLLSSALVIYAHPSEKRKVLSFFVLSSLFGFFLEVIGVRTSIVFGSYNYGSSLGWKLLDVPLIIGVNWFLLTIMFGSLLKPLRLNWIIKAVVASVFMVALDYLIEPVAIFLDYWSWDGNKIPPQNYMGWFGASLVLQVAYHKFKFKNENPLSLYLLVAQLVFFVSIQLFLVSQTN